MQVDEWKRKLTPLIARGVPKDGFDEKRLALIEAYSLLDAAPTAIAEAYVDIDDDLFAAARSDPPPRIARRGSSTSNLTDREAALRLGALVRRLDHDVAMAAPFNGPPSDPNVDYFCKAGAAFVIPMLSPKKVGRGFGSRRSIRRRATLYHKVVPRKVEGYSVKLHCLPDDAAPDDGGAVLGAAMFENFELSVAPKEGTHFRAEAVVCKGIDDAIEAHVARAAGDGCVMIAWPELTMPGPQLERMRQAMRQHANRDQAPDNLKWALSGSWHQGAESVRNIAYVVDRFGETVLEHVKSRPYRDNVLGREDIILGTELNLLITSGHLIAFGLCKDFCDLVSPTPYDRLNADLVVVGSLANEETMLAHRTVAHTLSMQGTRTFVVQQQETRTGVGQVGWVVPPTDHPQGLTPAGSREGAWSSHEWILRP